MYGRSMGPTQVSVMSGQLSLQGLSRRSEQRVRLPSNVIGSLIGKGGCHINEIRQFSGATVQIEENKKDSRMSDVVIAGTPEAVSCATFLINARISAGRNAIKNRRQGGQGGQGGANNGGGSGDERRGRRNDRNDYNRE
eukprot:TCONS_00051311-protein